MEKDQKNIVCIATLTTIYHEKGTKRQFIDKTTYGFISSSFTEKDKKEFSEIVKKGMEKKMEEYYGADLKKRFSKIDYKCTFRTTEVDFIIRVKDE